VGVGGGGGGGGVCGGILGSARGANQWQDAGGSKGEWRVVQGPDVCLGAVPKRQPSATPVTWSGTPGHEIIGVYGTFVRWEESMA